MVNERTVLKRRKALYNGFDTHVTHSLEFLFFVKSAEYCDFPMVSTDEFQKS